MKQPVADEVMLSSLNQLKCGANSIKSTQTLGWNLL